MNIAGLFSCENGKHLFESETVGAYRKKPWLALKDHYKCLVLDVHGGSWLMANRGARVADLGPIL